MKELLRVLFIGDDWAEDHHDVEIEDDTAAARPQLFSAPHQHRPLAGPVLNLSIDGQRTSYEALPT